MQTLSQNLTETLRDWLLHGRLKPGERIEGVPLARTMGVSRTPVRAALATLASEGLIDHPAKRGHLVKGVAVENGGRGAGDLGQRRADRSPAEAGLSGQGVCAGRHPGRLRGARGA